MGSLNPSPGNAEHKLGSPIAVSPNFQLASFAPPRLRGLLFGSHQASGWSAGNLINKRRPIMTKSNKPQSASNQPTHIAYHVRNANDDKAFWTRIGSAWQHADGNGFNLQIETVPLDGRITLRVPSEKN